MYHIPYKKHIRRRNYTERCIIVMVHLSWIKRCEQKVLLYAFMHFMHSLHVHLFPFIGVESFEDWNEVFYTFTFIFIFVAFVASLWQESQLPWTLQIKYGNCFQKWKPTKMSLWIFTSKSQPVRHLCLCSGGCGFEPYGRQCNRTINGPLNTALNRSYSRNIALYALIPESNLSMKARLCRIKEFLCTLYSGK